VNFFNQNEELVHIIKILFLFNCYLLVSKFADKVLMIVCVLTKETDLLLIFRNRDCCFEAADDAFDLIHFLSITIII